MLLGTTCIYDSECFLLVSEKILQPKLEQWLSAASVSHAPARAVIAPYPLVLCLGLLTGLTCSSATKL